MNNRLASVESQVVHLSSGSRGASCESLVDKLGEAARAGDKAAVAELERLTDKWGCRSMPVSFEKQQSDTSPDQPLRTNNEQPEPQEAIVDR